VSRYTVYVIPRAWQEMKDLPGNVRQRVKWAVAALAEDPRPPKSKALVAPKKVTS
jgi:mRNA interferase RelE/StbE